MQRQATPPPLKEFRRGCAAFCCCCLPFSMPYAILSEPTQPRTCFCLSIFCCLRDSAMILPEAQNTRGARLRDDIAAAYAMRGASAGAAAAKELQRAKEFCAAMPCAGIRRRPYRSCHASTPPRRVSEAKRYARAPRRGDAAASVSAERLCCLLFSHLSRYRVSLFFCFSYAAI